MGKMEQEAEYSRAGSNSSRTFKVAGEITSMVPIHIEDISPVLQFRMFLEAPDWMDLVSGTPEWMGS